MRLPSKHASTLQQADLLSGATKPESPKSEAVSYYELATHKGFITEVNAQSVITEEFARDTYENILFSIARFYQYTCRWPTHITAISHAFKEKRITELHLAAIRWSPLAFRYIGIDPVGKSADELAKDESVAYEMWKQDPYAGGLGKLDLARGTRGPWKDTRNPWKHQAPYVLTCPSLSPLMEWAGGDDSKTIFPHSVPWDILWKG